MIAKIGFVQLMTTLNRNDFRHICLPYILGESGNLSYVVGANAEADEPDADKGYVLRTAGFGNRDRLMLVAEVRLYANAQTPTYHVLVGDVWGQGKIEMVMSKLGQIDFATFQAGPESVNPSVRWPWAPNVWPLPFWN